MIIFKKNDGNPTQEQPQCPAITKIDDVTGRIRRASFRQGIALRVGAPGAGSVARSALRHGGVLRGSFRKYPAQTKSHTKVDESQHDKMKRATTSTGATAGHDQRGVTAIAQPREECVIPCANPQLLGVQRDMARVAVGNAAPSPKPNARRSAKSETNP